MFVALREGVHQQPKRVRVCHHAGGRVQHTVLFVDGTITIGVGALRRSHRDAARADQIRLPGANAIGVGGHFFQACGGQQVFVRARVVGKRKVEGFVKGRRKCDGAVDGHIVTVHQLHEFHLRAAAQVLQVGNFKTLNEHRSVAVVHAETGERRQQFVFERQAQGAVKGRVFGLGVDADHTAFFFGLAAHQLQYLVKRRDFEQAVERLVAAGRRLHGAQGFDLCQREVGSEEAFFIDTINVARGPAAGEFQAGFHVGGVDHVGLVPRD